MAEIPGSFLRVVCIATRAPSKRCIGSWKRRLGLLPDTVSILGRTSGWLRYRLPKRYVRKNEAPVCIGQKQIWFLLRLVAPESDIRLDAHEAPEFDHWRWVSFWYPVTAVVDFKQDVYRQALTELAARLSPSRKTARKRRRRR